MPFAVRVSIAEAVRRFDFIRKGWNGVEYWNATGKGRFQSRVMSGGIQTVLRNDRVCVVRLDLGPYGTNAYVVSCAVTRASVLIDAPGEIDVLLSALKGTFPQLILMTHSHFDHVGALAHLRAQLEIPLAAHPMDAEGLPVPVDRFLEDGDRIGFGMVELVALHTPGHTPGSLCFFMEGLLISGDTLFPGGPGRTGTPQDFQEIQESIRRKILVLPDDVRIFPGHGEGTILSRERPLIESFTSRRQAPGLCGDVLWENP